MLTLPAVPDGGDGKRLFRSLRKLANIANSAHKKALVSATDAVEHAARSGEALCKARELCNHGEWAEFVETEFQGSMRTAQKYMRLARNWRALQSQGPAARLSSQTQAAKALTAIVQGDTQPAKKRKQNKSAARGAFESKAAAFARDVISILAAVRLRVNEHAMVNAHAREASSELQTAAVQVRCLATELFTNDSWMTALPDAADDRAEPAHGEGNV